MAEYKVIADFRDIEDKNKHYKTNESFPQPASKKVAKKRIDELLSHENKAGYPVIKEIESDKE